MSASTNDHLTTMDMVNGAALSFAHVGAQPARVQTQSGAEHQSRAPEVRVVRDDLAIAPQDRGLIGACGGGC